MSDSSEDSSNSDDNDEMTASEDEEISDEECEQTLFLNGSIYTVTEVTPWAEAVLVICDTIAFVGSNTEAMEYASTNAVIINLGKKMMMPGIHDVHMHPLEAGSNNFDFTLDQQEADIQTLIEEIEKANLAKPDSSWLLGWGHDLFAILDLDENPKDILDGISSNRPIAIMEQTSHSIWCNSEALKKAGITKSSPNPNGGVIMRDGNDNPNGILMDNAGNLLVDIAIKSIPSSEENDYLGLRDYSFPKLASHGITSICDARTYWKRNHHMTWKRLADEDKLTARVNLSLWAYPNEDDFIQISTFKSLFYKHSGGLLKFNQIKVYADGIVPNTTAAMHDDYLFDLLGQTTNTGLNYFTEARLGNYIKELEPVGFDFHIHAIGNRGISESLNAIEKNASDNGRHRLTHLEVVDTSDYKRFVDLNVTADCQVAGDFTQPYAWHDNDDFIDSYLNNNIIPLKGLYSSGARITLSSDWDVSTLNPFVGMQNAVLRSPQEISLKEVVKGYTINAAYVMRQEEKVGTIEVGKEADLIVLDQNIFEIGLDQITNTKVMMTYLQGKQIYPAELIDSIDQDNEGTSMDDINGMADSSIVDQDCLDIVFPVHAIFAGDSVEINSILELRALLTLCEIDDFEETPDSAVLDTFIICLEFVFPFEVVAQDTNITIENEESFISFLNKLDSLHELFDFVYPLKLVHFGNDTLVNSVLDFLDILESCPGEIVNFSGTKTSRFLRTEHRIPTKSNASKNTRLLVYPNPVYEELVLSLPSSSDGEGVYSIDIFDETGKSVMHINKATHLERINTTNLTSGVYFIQAQNKDELHSASVIIEN